MRIIGRLVSAASSLAVACPPRTAFLSFIVDRINVSSPSSSSPDRMPTFRSVSSFPNRQTFSFPSAVIRRRLHPPQKWLLVPHADTQQTRMQRLELSAMA